MTRAPLAKDDQFARIAPYYDQLMASVPYARWVDYILDLALFVRRPMLPGARLLDLATGTGSVALEFTKRGYVVAGMDLSEPMLEVARRKAKQLGLMVTFFQSNLSKFTIPEKFDYAVCLYDSLNYLLDPDDLKHTFGNIYRALTATGIFIFDVNTVHALEAELFTQTSPPDAPVRYRWQSKYDRETRISTIRMHFEIRADQERIDIIHRQRAYTEAELRSFLFHAGFREVHTFDAYRLTAPTITSDRVFYTALVRK